MITLVSSELLTSPAQVLVNPVNTTGTMSSGLSARFKQVFPDMFTHYARLCHNDQFDIGQLMLFRTAYKWVLNFPIKKHPRANAKLDYIEAGLQKFASVYGSHRFASVAFPPLGAEDGLDWKREIHPLMESYLGALPIMTYVHTTQDPFNDPLRADVIARRLHAPVPDVPFETFWRDLARVIRRESAWQTLEETPHPFTVTLREEMRPKRFSISITPQDDETHFFPQSVIRELWEYLLLTDYALPHNLPSGLERVGVFVVALVARLGYIRPVHLVTSEGQAVVGLRYLAPVK